MSDQKNDLVKRFYGSRLFLKFFMWFWAIVAITTVLVGTYVYYVYIEPETRQFDQIHFENLLEAAGRMAEAYESEGASAAAILAIKGVDWFFDAELNNILDEVERFPGSLLKKRKTRPVPGNEPVNTAEESKSSNMKKFQKKLSSEQRGFKKAVEKNHDRIVAFAGQILAGAEVYSVEIDGLFFQGCLVTSSAGNKYVALRHLPWKNSNRKWFLLRRVFDALPLLIFISAPLCYFLGRYMARPVIDISEASRKFASGELSTRITSAALNRYDEIGDLATDFNQMANQLETMIKGQQKLLGDISHELRSPLARLQVALEILQKKSTTADSSMLDRINIEIARLNQLIGQILELNRIGATLDSCEFAEVELDLILKKICEDGQFEAGAKNIKLQCNDFEKIKINADAALLEQAIENLLRNAIKYSPENSSIKIMLDKDAENDRLKISIVDHGPGINEVHFSRIFEPFYRCDEDRDRKTGGAGLGLTIAQKAAQAHNGKITLTNLEEGGLKAEIILPL